MGKWRLSLDDSGGVNFWRFDYGEPLEVGDRIRITGPLWPDADEQVYIGNFACTIIDSGLTPTPIVMTPLQLESTYRNTGSFASVTGVVDSLTTDRFVLMGYSGRAEVRRTAYTGVSFSEVVEGVVYTVVGACVKEGAAIWLSPREQSDIIVGGVSGWSDDSGNVPQVFRLLAAFPNPFNPMTRICFDLPEQAEVRLTVYDVAGRCVRKLKTGEVYGAGRHESTWNGRNDMDRAVAAGVYFYRLDAGTFSETKRMVLVK